MTMMMKSFHFVLVAAVAAVTSFSTSARLVQAWVTPQHRQQSPAAAASRNMEQQTTPDDNMMTRKSMLQTLVRGGVVAAAGVATSTSSVASSLVGSTQQQQWSAWAASVQTLPSGVSYEVVKAGDGPKPEIGELVAIRFAAFCGDRKIDDIFDTPEPYYTRLGSGGLLKGVEQTLPLMKVGDRWKLTIPGSLAFGPKGRPASAGKPRIPSDAEIIFDVEMVGLPGKEPELIELIGSVDE